MTEPAPNKTDNMDSKDKSQLYFISRPTPAGSAYADCVPLPAMLYSSVRRGESTRVLHTANRNDSKSTAHYAACRQNSCS
jgi:hypothetical protein